MQKRYFEEFRVGEVVELGSHQVGEDEIIAFARQFDPQPFHIDPELARTSFFGGLVASGWHTAAIYMRLLVDGLLNNTDSMGSPGVDELRWLKPLRPGTTVRARFTVLETIPSRSRPNLGIIRGRGELLNNDDEVVMSMVSVGFFGRVPAPPV